MIKRHSIIANKLEQTALNAKPVVSNNNLIWTVAKLSIYSKSLVGVHSRVSPSVQVQRVKFVCILGYEIQDAILSYRHLRYKESIPESISL
jgi:hypothetical protein